MGMYTELVLNVELKDGTADVPRNVIAVLNHLANGADEPDALPDHPFFSCSRWGCVLQMSSFYFTPFANTKFEQRQGNWYLSTRFDLKNYEDEIGHFVDWLLPYVNAFPGDFLGYRRYEEDQKPTLIFYPD